MVRLGQQARILFDDVGEKTLRTDERDHPAGFRERVLRLLRVQNAEGDVDRFTDPPVAVVDHFAGVEAHPEPHLRLRCPRVVVPAERDRDPVRQQVGDEAFRRSWWQKDQYAVSAIFVRAGIEVDAAVGEGRLQHFVHALMDGEPVERVAIRRGEPHDVHHDDRAVESPRRSRHWPPPKVHGADQPAPTATLSRRSA